MTTPIQHAKQQKQQSARWCPCCGQIAVVPKGEPSPWPKVTGDMIRATPAMLEALRDLVGIICSMPGYPERDVTIEDCDVAKAALLAATGKDTP